MLTALRRLGLEVTDLDTARAFYEDRLGLVPRSDGSDAPPASESGADSSVEYAVGETTLRLRRPTDRPRGGVHTHYAFATTPAAYSRWLRRLADLDPEEFSFGTTDSLYVDDPAGHCVEIGSVDRSGADAGDGDASSEETENNGAENNGAENNGAENNDAENNDAATGGAATDDPPPLSGIFEVVLEVIDLAAAEERYRRLGFEVVDRGDERRRVRLSGPVDLELWEPQLGIADGRGGLHVDLAFESPNPDAAVEAGAPWKTGPYPVEGGLRVVDDDGHVLTFLRSDA